MRVRQCHLAIVLNNAQFNCHTTCFVVNASVLQYADNGGTREANFGVGVSNTLINKARHISGSPRVAGISNFRQVLNTLPISVARGICCSTAVCL